MSVKSDLKILKKMKEIFEFGCDPNEWESNVLKFKEYYKSLDDSIKNKKVTLEDYVTPDPLSQKGKNTAEFDTAEAEHSLAEFINLLDENTSQRSLMRQSITIGGQCWWAGQLSSILEKLTDQGSAKSGGRRRRKKTRKKRGRSIDQRKNPRGGKRKKRRRTRKKKGGKKKKLTAKEYWKPKRFLGKTWWMPRKLKRGMWFHDTLKYGIPI